MLVEAPQGSIPIPTLPPWGGQIHSVMPDQSARKVKSDHEGEKAQLLRQIEQEAQDPNSILNICNTENQITNVARLMQRGLSLKQSTHYLEQNVLGAMLEHARTKEMEGNDIHPTTIHGLLTEATMVVQGINTIELYRKTAEMVPHGARERHEFAGYQILCDKLNALVAQLPPGQQARGYWVSPPYTDSTYAFVFEYHVHVAADGEHHVTITSWPYTVGEKGDPACATSNEIHKTIAHALGNTEPKRLFTQAKEFLLAPLVGQPSEEGIRAIYRAINATEKRTEQAHAFAKEVRTTLTLFITEYINHIMQAAKYPNGTPQYADHVTQAKVYLHAIYNGARAINQRMIATEHNEEARALANPIPSGSFDTYDLACMVAGWESSMTVGTSCPSVSPSSTGGMSEWMGSGYSGIPWERRIMSSTRSTSDKEFTPHELKTQHADTTVTVTCHCGKGVVKKTVGAIMREGLTCPHCRDHVSASDQNALACIVSSPLHRQLAKKRYSFARAA